MVGDPNSKRDNGRGWNLFDFGRLRHPPEIVAAIVYVAAALLLLLLIYFSVAVSVRLVMSVWSAKPDHINKLLLALAGLIGAPFVIWRVLIAARGNVIAQENVHTTLLTKAIEQLGATRETKDTKETKDQEGHPKFDTITQTTPNIEVRIGAIYSLEKIARDNNSLHWQVLEILCSYIRANADPYSKSRPGGTLGGASVADERFETPRIDVQTALTVIGHRSATLIKQEDLWRNESIGGRSLHFDISQTNLRGATLNSASWAHADFSYSILQFARMLRMDASRSAFQKSDLRAAILTEAQLERALFIDADLTATVMNNAQLGFARFERCNLGRAVCQGADFSNAALLHVDATAGDFRSAVLKSTNILNANLERANFHGAKLTGAVLAGCFIDGADFSDAEGMTDEQVAAAWGNWDTKLLAYLNRPKNDRWLDGSETADFALARSFRWTQISGLSPEFNPFHYAR